MWGSMVCLIGLFSCKNLDDCSSPSPNIIIILIDDQGYADLSAYPHAAYDVQTPNMDRLAREGILFTRAYSASSICSPSRAGLFTGRYPHRWGGWRYRTGLPEKEVTLAEYLSENGYMTGLIGKNDWGAGYVHLEDRAYPLNSGYRYFFGFSYLWHEYFITEQDLPEGDPARYRPFGPLQYNSGNAEIANAYTTEIFTDSAISYINRYKDSPFLLVLSYNAVHDLVQQVPETYLKKHQLPAIPNYKFGTEPYSSYYERYGEIGHISYGNMRKYYLANLNCLDDQIGRFLNSIDELGLTQNTLIILMGDNGGSPQSGSVNYPLSGSKYLTLEGGIRVPMIFRWPEKFQPNQLCSESVTAYDILPTCLEAAGISLPDSLDGCSVLGSLSGKSAEWDSDYPLFFELRDQYAVIEGDWKLVKSREIHYRYGSILKTWPAEGDIPRLYNIKDDPGEHVDLSEVETDRAAELLRKYSLWHDQIHLTGEKYILEQTDSASR